jgi:hypothetical protein
MKPELVVQDFGGAHNKDLARTSARLIKGGSWKKQRVVTILPSAALIPAKVALSHWNLIFPPNQGVVRILALGMEVGDAYSNAIEQVLAHPDLSQWEYILTLEHDNAPPQDGLLKLLARMEDNPQLSCIGGLYYTKGEGGVAQIWGDAKDPMTNFRPQPPDPAGGLVECCGTGMGFNLWRMELFKDKRLPRPLFRTKASLAEGVGTQDLAFWTEARKLGYRCAVDCGVLVGHYDHAADFMW